MSERFDSQRVSIALLRPRPLPYETSQFQECLNAALAQDPPVGEILVVDAPGDEAPPPYRVPEGAASTVVQVRAEAGTRAALGNAALSAATGEFLLLLFTGEAPVLLRKSAARTMLMAATRRAAPGLVYADYERIEADGRQHDVHLLDWHVGRLRDTFDFGAAVLLPVALMRELGGFNEALAVADWYDLRLRLSERAAPAHIANRFAGALYTVVAAAKAHSVFDYLLASKEAQVELETACTEHLQRIGACLKPGAHVQPVEYASGEQDDFGECIASVVIPVYQRPEFIGRAIESVQAQTVRAVEVIVVVNGGPDDPTADAVRQYLPEGDRFNPDAPPVRLLVVDANNLGLCLNSGIAAARGKYYVQLDSDDRLKPDAVEKLLAVFDSDPTVGMVVGSYEVWTLNDKTGELSRNEEIPVVTHDEWTPDNGRNNLLRINGAGAPRAAHVKVIAEAGWFGVNDTPQCRNYGEDYDLVLRISERHTIGRVWEPIYEVIRHAGSTDHAIDQSTIDRNNNAKDAMRLEAIERRRALNGTAVGGEARAW